MKTRALVVIGMILLMALTRLFPHPANFAPVGAMALFAAAHLGSRWAAFLLPVTAMLVSDLALHITITLGLQGGWLAQGAGFYDGMWWVVYLAIVLVTFMGLSLRNRTTIVNVAACTLAASILYFLVTNFAWWAGYNFYPHTAPGLILCYEKGLEFFHWTLLGDAFYATVLFGGFAAAEKYYPALRPTTA